MGILEEKKPMSRADILSAFEGLSHSQGFYGRLLMSLKDAEENNPEAYEEYMSNLEAQQFTSVVDLVIYIEE